MMFLADPRPRQIARGFTLVELLIVIGIIALLISILLPVLNLARKAANETRCMSNLRQWGIAYAMYCDANRGCVPNDGDDGAHSSPVGYWDTTAPQPPHAVAPMWFNALPPYLGQKPYGDLQVAMLAGGQPLPIAGDDSLFCCPDALAAAQATGDTLGAVSNGYFLIYGLDDTSTSVARPTFFCYVPNSKLDSGQPAEKLSQFRDASTTALLVEKRMKPDEISFKASPLDGVTFWPKSLARAKSDWQRFAGRHRKGGFILFVDGHVSWFSNDELAHPPGAYFASPQNYNILGKITWYPFGPAN